jgi:hypothetical protein
VLDCSHRASLALAASLLLAAVGCGPTGSQGITRPTPTPQGSPIGSPASQQIGAAGGTITSPDGVLAVSIPAGALSSTTQFSIQPITNTAPSGAGSSYLLGPEGATFLAPVTLTFRAAPTGRSVDALTVAYQDGAGYWLRVAGVQRDAAAGTLTATTNHFSGWALVATPTPQDLSGSFTYGSTVAIAGIPFTATGSATLNFLGSDSSESAYLAGGTITIAPGTAGCIPAAATVPLDTNIAEAVNSPPHFLWGIAARWDVTCTSPGLSLPVFTAFDTAGISLIKCSRGYVGTPVIGPNRVAGTYTIDCGADGHTTAAWDLVTPICGQQCTSSNPCHTAVWSCATGTAVCTDSGNVTPGTGCGTNMVCSPAGACISCTAELPCTTNPNQCVQGATSCATGAETCVDTTTNVPSLGTSCVIAGDCFQDTLACVANVPTCTPTTTPLAAGTICGTNLVCDGAGACNACTAGLACSTNPNQCVLGTTSCATGAETCIDTATSVPSMGTSCVVPGSCFQDTVTCLANVPTCTPTTTPLPAGAICGTNLVCNGAGACNACTAGLACSTNPNQCVLGTTSCATGAETCIDTATNVPSIGTSCVIPGSCFQDAVACVANVPTCTPTSTPLAAGTSCGTNLVCNGAGACGACSAGLACSTNPNPCVAGTTSCATGAPTCVDTTTNIAAGTSCGVNLVCNGAGACTPCTAGSSCSTNPNQCVLGTTSCATGTQTCVDTTTNVPSIGTSCVIPDSCFQDAITCVANVPTCTATTAPLAAGTSCGTNLVCNGAGACNACAAGVACSTNPNQCVLGTTSCITGAQTCIDTTTNVPSIGTPCVIAGDCFQDTVACVANTPTCTATATPLPAGTSCGTNMVCSPTQTCIACAQGASCTPANPCHVGTTECSSGAPACTDTAATQPNGTACGTGLTCNAGTCVPSHTVTGTRLVSYWPDPPAAQVTAAAPDVAAATILALAPDGGGGWATYTGTFAADGSFSVPTVPTGSYLLVLGDGSGTYYIIQTSSSTVDLGYDILGRADAVPPTLPTQVTYSLTGLGAPGNEVQLTSSNADLWHVAVLAGEDWFTAGLDLLAASDVLYVHDLSTQTSGAFSYLVATDWSSQSAAAMTNGLPATIAATLGPAALDGSIAVDWRTSQFENLLPAMNPAAATDAMAHTLVVSASAFPLANPAPAVRYGTPTLFLLQQPVGNPDITLGPVSYGRFLDPLWNEWRGVDFAARVSYQAPPPATTPWPETVSAGRRDPMVPAPATPIVPTLGPVQSPAIGGVGAFANLTGVGLAPTLSWSPPAIGVPTSYAVEIFWLHASGTASVGTLVGTFATGGTATQFPVPPGILQAGNTYYARITARAISPDLFDTAPFRTSNLWTYASTLTGTFSP